MSRFLREQYRDMEPYTPGEQPKMDDLIKLNTNENPYPPSPAVTKALHEKNIEELVRYPDPEASVLTEAIAGHFGVKRSQVAVGNGSDEILAFIYMAFGENIYYPAISYGFYPVFAETFMCSGTEIPLTEDLRIDPEDYKGLGGTIIIANPNAPTGMALTREEIAGILESNRDNLVVIDEAYVDFGAESCVPLLGKYDNLLIVQTFSKSHSLAGARIGAAIGSEEIIQDINKMKFSFNPYNLDRLAILAGTAAIEDEEYFRECCGKVIATRKWFVEEMEALGFEVLPSSANFIFARNPKIPGKEYFTKLRERAIVVRHFDKDPIRDYVRITIGRDEDMKKLIAVTEEILCGKVK